MKEKLPLGERPDIKVVGKVPKEEKEKLVARYESVFGSNQLADISPELFEKIKSQEKIKTKMEKDFIKKSNEITNSLLEQSGLQPFDIPEDNIHFIPADLYHEINPDLSSMAVTVEDRQAIIVNADIARRNPLMSAHILFHEMSHLKNYVVIEMRPKTYEHAEFRGGLQINSSFRKSEAKKRILYKSHIGLNEAIVADMEKKYAPEVLRSSDDPIAQQVVEMTETDEFRNHVNKIAEKYKMPADEIIWVSDMTDASTATIMPYSDQIRVFDYIAKEIAEDGKEEAENIKKLFYSAHYNGKIIGLAKLIEKSFGKGSFRFIGTMTKDRNSAHMVLDYLQKQRRLKAGLNKN